MNMAHSSRVPLCATIVALALSALAPSPAWARASGSWLTQQGATVKGGGLRLGGGETGTLGPRFFATVLPSTQCPPAAPSGIPKARVNGTFILATPGWVAGRFRDNIVSPSAGPTKKIVYKWVDARTCYKKAVCDHASDGVAYLSWVAITNGLTKGHCQLFIEEVCSGITFAASKRLPFFPDVARWYSTSTKQPLDDPDSFC